MSGRPVPEAWDRPGQVCPMIGPDYCGMMARYNAWQNGQLAQLLMPLTPQELRRDRGGFFGSILGTLDHILWGDQMWMSRFDGGPAPEGGIKDSTDRNLTLDAWSAARFRMDGRIRLWAGKVKAIDLAGPLTWYSGAAGRQVSRPLAQCVVHMFNHQTHHRGQVHAMMTAAGLTAPVSDLAFMPEDS
ncbi:DinB family protein [Sedimentitalea sp. HM32M-2]|uniref:DinB family protein n=1 Tax=Sedimentitalea sp. HM32M-2 TaxID=3351566 RepID=UPI00363BC914